MERAFRLAAWQFWANAKWKMAQSWEKQPQMWDVYRLYLCSEFLVFTCKIPMLSDHQEYLLSQVCKYLSLLRWFLGYWTFSTSELFNVVVSKLYFWIFLIFFSQLKLSAHKLDWYLAFITLTQKLMSCLLYFCACWHQAFWTWNDSVKHEILCFNQNDFLLLLMWPFSWGDLINKFIW